MQVYYDRDADLPLIEDKAVIIIGHGSQGHAHAANLKDSDVNAITDLRQGGSWKKAEAAGHDVRAIAEATKTADVAMTPLPDGNQPIVYKSGIKPNSKEGAILTFTCSLNVHYNQIVPRAGLDVIMVAPKGPSHTVRSESLKGGGVSSLITVYQDKSDKARDIALSCAATNGSTKGGAIETSFREEAKADLFGEQVVLCGDVVKLIRTGSKTLTEIGYTPEMAHFECLHEMRFIAGLIYEGGITNMNYSISSNAEYGEYITGVEVINDKSREAMRSAPERIQTGEYAKMFIQEGVVSYISMTARRHLTADYQIEKTGAQLRPTMSWTAKNKLVGQDRN